MFAEVSWSEIAPVLLTAAAFLPLAVALGAALSRSGITVRDGAGALRKGPCTLIALCFAVLIFAHAMAAWWIGCFHPVLNAFYGSGAAIAVITTRGNPRPASKKSTLER